MSSVACSLSATVYCNALDISPSLAHPTVILFYYTAFFSTLVNASTYFNPIADVRVEACEFFGLMCTEVLYQEDYNLCTGLNLEDPYGYQACEREELYSFEVSYMLPNHTWWEDLAVNGFTFQAYVTLDSSLYCHATFETQVYYDTGAWVKMAVGSVMIAAAVAVYYKKKMPRGVIDLCAAEQQMKDDTDYTVEVVETKKNSNSNSNSNSNKSMIISKNNSNKQQLLEDASSIIQNNIKNSNNNNQQHPKVQYVQQEEYGDDESVTTTSYMRMLDFSPSGLSHADRMEQVRQAHFERLRMTRESRRARLSNHNNTATSRGR